MLPHQSQKRNKHQFKPARKAFTTSKTKIDIITPDVTVKIGSYQAELFGQGELIFLILWGGIGP